MFSVLPLRLSTWYAVHRLSTAVNIDPSTPPDLPYIYSTEGKIKEPNLAAEAGQGLMSAVTSYARGDMVCLEPIRYAPESNNAHV